MKKQKINKYFKMDKWKKKKYKMIEKIIMKIYSKKVYMRMEIWRMEKIVRYKKIKMNSKRKSK